MRPHAAPLQCGPHSSSVGPQVISGATTVILPWQKLPLSQNQRETMHRMKVAGIKRVMLDDARKAIARADVPAMAQAVVVLNWQQPDRRGRDGDGAAPALKACLDALVKEGVLVDDSWQYVRHSGITCHDPIKGEPGAFWLTLTPA